VSRARLVRTDEASARLASDVLAFLRVYRWAITVAVGAALLAHGVALTSASLSLDDELHVIAPRISGISIGRPTIALVKALSQDLMPLPFWNTALALTLLLAAGIAFAFLLMRAAHRPDDHRAAITVFLVVFMTLPLTAYWLMWGESAIAYAFGLLLAAVAALFSWLWLAEGWGRNAALASAATAFFVITTYQSQVFVAVAGALAANLALELRESRAPFRLRDRALFSAKLPMPIVAGGLIGAIVTARMVWDGNRGSHYHASFLAWGSEDPIVIFRALLQHVIDYATGEGFYGGWVLIPTLAVAVALMVHLVWRALHGANWWGFVLFASLVLSPFGASVLLGTALLPRSMQALPLVAGAVWVLCALTCSRAAARHAVLIAAALVLTLWHSSVTSRLYHVELTTYEVDRGIASAIVERLAARGWDGASVPLVTVGARPPTVIEDIDNADAFGYPLFNELGSGGRSIPFMKAMGFSFEYPTLEDRAKALTIAEAMPDWPADGAVVLQDGLAIVRFAEATVS
jgi:hypothetical protein